MKSMLFMFLWLFVFLLTSEEVRATTGACKDLVSELNLLRKAQNQIIVGLADNHQQMAKSLDEISAQLRFSNKAPSLRVSNNINNTASAYHKRGERAKDQAQALDEATADLIGRIAICLKK